MKSSWVLCPVLRSVVALREPRFKWNYVGTTGLIFGTSQQWRSKNTMSCAQSDCWLVIKKVAREVQAFSHMKNLHDRLFVMIWKQRRIRWNSSRHQTWVSRSTTQFRPKLSQRSSISKTDQKGSEKKKKRGAVVSQENESIRQRTAEGNFLAEHKTRNRWTKTVEQSPLQQRSSQKTKAAKSTVIVFVVPQQADWEQFFCRRGKKFGG